jgi:hypothetical protein
MLMGFLNSIEGDVTEINKIKDKECLQFHIKLRNSAFTEGRDN